MTINLSEIEAAAKAAHWIKTPSADILAMVAAIRAGQEASYALGRMTACNPATSFDIQALSELRQALQPFSEPT